MDPERIQQTGLNKQWVDGLSDWVPEDLRNAYATLAEIPVKKCEATVGCENDATHYVDFHGCDSACSCEEHRDLWLYEINRSLSMQGEIPCTDCGLRFRTAFGIMKFRKI